LALIRTISRHEKASLVVGNEQDGRPPMEEAESPMPTFWGILERVQIGDSGKRAIQVRTSLRRGAAIHIRALIEKETTVARGVERVDLSNLKEGEFVGVTYHHGRDGFMEADTVYVPPDGPTA